MDKIKKIARSTKEFVENHQFACGMVVASAVLIPINRMALKEHDNFLRDNDLYEKFYRPEM